MQRVALAAVTDGVIRDALLRIKLGSPDGRRRVCEKASAQLQRVGRT